MIVALCEHDMLLKKHSRVHLVLKRWETIDTHVYCLAETDRQRRLVSAEEEVRNSIHSERL